MKRPLFMGIDGGGSSLRIAIAAADMTSLATLARSGVNPSIIGHNEAQARIRRGIVELLTASDLQPDDIAAVGIGIAGASNMHSVDWLTDTVKPVLPASLLVPGSDLEIALVGALAQRSGILLLAGTGSAVFGVSAAGMRLQVGGWGYLLGDEGSGYWIGMQLLRHVITQHDRGAIDPLSRDCLDALGLKEARDLIAWTYRSDEAPAARIASLASIVLEMAADGVGFAERCLREAASCLVQQVELMRTRLDAPEAPIAFAGGLLDNDNFLSAAAARALGLPKRPLARFPPVIGAALLAKMEWSSQKK